MKILKLNVETLAFEEVKVKHRKVGFEDIQKVVDGYIERFAFNKRIDKAKIDCWCCEDGKLREMNPSIAIIDKADRIIEIIAGSVCFTSRDDAGNSLSLTDEQIKLVKDELQKVALLKSKYSSGELEGIERIEKVRVMRYAF